VTAARLLPPLGWTVVVAWLSTSAWGGHGTARLLLALARLALPDVGLEDVAALHAALRKAAHVAEYAVLAGLWRRALLPASPRRAAWGALALCVLTASLDEGHQAVVPGRTGSVLDVLLDTAGAVAALAVLGAGARRAADRLATALLWFAALGGSAVVGLEWATAAPPGWLWGGAPLGWVALGARRAWRG